MRTFRLLLLSALISLAASTAGSAQQGRWFDVGGTFERDISGLTVVHADSQRVLSVVVHDNKYPDEVRFGLLGVSRDGEVRYRPLAWPEEMLKPVDLESLSAHPDGDGSLLALTSKGVGAHVRINDERTAVEVIATFEVPLPVEHRPEAEGFVLWRAADSTLWALWGDRGSDEIAGTLFWGRFNPENYGIAVEGSQRIRVPWPTTPEVRHLSELRVDAAGVVMITSASEASNDGPFDGAVYVAGTVQAMGDELLFTNCEPLVAVQRFPGRKLEALDMIGSSDSGLILGTDNENQGSAIYIGGWSDADTTAP